jgi:hypothetical protein
VKFGVDLRLILLIICGFHEARRIGTPRVQLQIPLHLEVFRGTGWRLESKNALAMSAHSLQSCYLLTVRKRKGKAVP